MTRSRECMVTRVGEMILGMEKTREFWLRLGVIGSAVILSSGLVALFS